MAEGAIGAAQRGARVLVLDEPAAALELGAVIVHYDAGALPAEAVGALEALAGEDEQVIVTPAASPIDGGRPVALTAWGHRVRCSGADLGAARRFIGDFAARGPGEAGS